MEKIISESLGRNLAVELDLKSGEVTLLDSERGVRLPPVSVFSLMRFLGQHKLVWMEAAALRVEEKAGEDAA